MPPKRVFGKDITNLDSRRPKNASICDKPLAEKSTLQGSGRSRSQSVDRRGAEQREALGEYEGEILAFMLSLQVVVC